MNQLMKLFALNRANAGRRFEIKTEANEATIYLYDAIVADDVTAEWWGGVSAQQFVREIKAITAPVIHLRINCPGGDVFAGRVMEQAIRQHTSKVIAHIDGYAASAASFLAIACDEVDIAKGGFIMIHKAWSIALGNSEAMTKMSELLDKIDESLVTSYVDETGQDADKVRAWMAAETWFNSNECVSLGFADRIAETEAKAKADWDLSVYDNAPKSKAKSTSQPAPLTDPAPPADPEPELENFMHNDHRARQQQRMNVLARTTIG